MTAAERIAADCAARCPAFLAPRFPESHRRAQQGLSGSRIIDRDGSFAAIWPSATAVGEPCATAARRHRPDSAAPSPPPRAPANCRAQTAADSRDSAAARCSTSHDPDRRPRRRPCGCGLEMSTRGCMKTKRGVWRGSVERGNRRGSDLAESGRNSTPMNTKRWTIIEMRTPSRTESARSTRGVSGRRSSKSMYIRDLVDYSTRLLAQSFTATNM